VPTPKALYTAALNQSIARYGSMEDATLREITQLLKTTRAQIAEQMAQAGDGGPLRLRQLQGNIDALIIDFEQRATDVVQASQSDAYEFGAEGAVKPLLALGTPGVAYLKPSAATLNVLLDFSGDLITGITSDIRQAVNIQIRQAALGQITPIQAARTISAAFGGLSKINGKTVATGITAKAERVMRTELQRVYNLSNFSQMSASAEVVPGLLKRWIATVDGKTRESHLRIHNETRIMPIPFNQPYILRTPGKAAAALMYPLDPSGPAHETINCRCTQATIHPAVGVIGSPLDGRIAAELKRRAA